MKYYPANLTVLSAEFVSTPTHVSITPDGRWIAVISDSRLYLFERDGDGYIERTGFSFGGSTQTIVCASFSPDGQTLALAYTGGVRLRYVKLDGSGNIVDSLNNASASGQGTCQLIVWSHDSSRLAFHHNGLSGKRLSFYDRDANGDLSHFANASTSAPYGAVGGAFNGGKNAYVSTYGETGDSHHYVLVGNTYSYRTTFNSGAIGVEYLGGDVMMFHFANSDPLLMEIPGYNRVAIPVTWPTLPPRPAYVATVRYGDGTARVFFVDQSSPGVLTPRSFVFDVDGTDTTILGGQEDHQFILPSGVSIEGPPKISDDIETMVFGASGASLLAIGTPNGNAAEITFPIFGAAAELQLDTSPRDGTASLGLTLLETDSFLGTGEHAEPIVAPNVVDPIPIASNGLAPQFNLVDPDFEYGYGISAFPAFAADGHVRPVHQVSGNLLYPTFNIQGEIDNPIAVFSDASYPNFNFKGELDVTIVAIQEGKLSFPAFETHGQAASPYTADSADLMLPQMEASGELVAPTWTASELMLPKLTSDGNVTMPIGVVGSEFFPPLTFQGRRGCGQ